MGVIQIPNIKDHGKKSVLEIVCNMYQFPFVGDWLEFVSNLREKRIIGSAL